MDKIIRTLARQYNSEPTDENAHRLAATVSRTIDDYPTVKVLSSGFGSGWSTWNTGDAEYTRLLLTFPPLVEAVERGDEITQQHPAYQALLDELDARGYDSPYSGGIGSLSVIEVRGPFVVNEYDGAEGITTLGRFLEQAICL